MFRGWWSPFFAYWSILLVLKQVRPPRSSGRGKYWPQDVAEGYFQGQSFGMQLWWHLSKTKIQSIDKATFLLLFHPFNVVPSNYVSLFLPLYNYFDFELLEKIQVTYYSYTSSKLIDKYNIYTLYIYVHICKLYMHICIYIYMYKSAIHATNLLNFPNLVALMTMFCPRRWPRLRDPYERLVAQFRGDFDAYGGGWGWRRLVCDVDSAIKKKMEDIISGADPGFLGISDVLPFVFRIFRDFRCFTPCFPGISDVLPFVFLGFQMFSCLFSGISMDFTCHCSRFFFWGGMNQ